MMYMFRVLVLGDTKLSLPFIVNGGVEHVSQDFELSRWTKKLNVGVDQCNLDIDVVVTSSSDFDSLIPTCDGILYFLDPNNLQDFELFDMIANIILEVRREIPIIVVFYTPDGFITIPSNFLFEYIWDFYPFEAFTFNQYSKNTLYEVLECLSEAIIVGSMPINIETAWMRIPFFLNKINNLVVNENWEQAAKLTTIFTQIKKRFENQDYFINAEQAAWLYYKLGNYLKASALLEGINDIDSKKFRKFYVQDLLHQANSLFKMKRFRNAAEKYEKAALWAKIELDETDSDIAQKALFNAINTWTSACEFQNSFRLLEKLDHTEQLLIMENLGPKIAAAADYLIENKRYDVVKSQLYFCIDKFQRVGLFDSVKILGEKIATVLKIFINNQIEEASPDSANLSLDELFNIWDTFNLERENLDNQIYEISNLFLKKHEFSIIDTLISQVEDLDIKTKISVDRSNAEESFKKSKKDVAQADLNVALEILEKYIKEEVSQFTESNKKVLEYVKSLKSEGQYWDTSLILKQRAQWYKKIGRKDFYNELLTETLETYIEGLLLIPFAQEINNLGNNVRTSYLMRVRGRLANSVEKYFEKKETTEKINNLMENLVRLYRNHLLYEESKELIRLQINFLTMRASERLFNTKGLLEIPTALSLIKQSEMLYGELSEKEHLKNDKIYGEIVKRYIEVEDYSKAARINEKIEDKEIFSVLHSQIQKFEEERSGEQIKDVQKIVNWKIKSEELSILKNHARDQLMTQQSVLKTRNALKRMLYKKLLNALSEKDYKNALELYKNSTISMIKQRKMETAGISYAIVGLLLIKTDSIRKLDMIKKEIDKKIGMSSKIFNETFPVKVIEFAKNMLNFNETSRGHEAIALYENLALFEEEKELLFSIIGKELLGGKPQQISEEHEEISHGISSTVTGKGEKVTDIPRPDKKVAISFNPTIIKGLIAKLEPRKKLFTKRKMMKRKYWDLALESLSSQRYSDSAKEYFKQIKFLITNGHDDYVPIALVMGIISLIKIKKIADGKRKLEKITMDLGTAQDVMKKLPEFSLLKKLLLAKESNNEIISSQILEGIIMNYPLFDIEKSLLINLSGKEVSTRISEAQTKEKIQKGHSTLLLNQQIANLKQSLGDIKSSSEKLLKKRVAMRRIYYKDILEKLKAGDYMKASELYKSVAIRITQRNDYDIAGMLILLGAGCLVLKNSPIDEIQKYMDEFLDSLGFTKKVLDESFGIKLLKFLLDARSIRNKTLFNQGWQMLSVLPLFEEEREIIN